MPITIYNTLTGKKEKFVPNNPPRVGFYVCGPTVYDYFHIGNARPLIVFDVIRRYLEYRGYKVTYVVNITDIDDKIINKANEENTSPATITERYIDAFFTDVQKLGVRRANHHPRATDNIRDMIELVRALLLKKNAYEVDGNVYFDVTSFPGYGKLSGRSLNELQAGARVEVNPDKRDPLDFILWKKSKENEPSWDSPWSKGRPGWHLECVVMSTRYLGTTVDIHGGGQDLIFPHHENEIAEAEAASGKPFVRFWLHNGFLDIRGRKMAKSEGNVIIVRDLIEKYDPVAVRIFFLLKHYRSPIDFSEELLEESGNAVDRLRNSYKELSHVESVEGTRSHLSTHDLKSESERELFTITGDFMKRFEETMDDDFNTAGALGHLFNLVKTANNVIAENRMTTEVKILLRKTRELMLLAGDLFGISYIKKQKTDSELNNKLLELLITIRQEARQKNNFTEADMIRKELEALGFILKDKKTGTTWEQIR